MTDKLQKEDEAGMVAAMAEMRADDKPEDWVLMELAAGTKNVLKLAGKGAGGLEEFKSNLPQNMPAWGVVRFTETIEKSPTEKINVTKYVFLQWLPDGVPMMLKANLGVLKGQISTFLSPYHVEFTPFSDPSEIDENMIRQKFQEASGTADKTRDRNADREDTPVFAGVPLGGTGQQQGAKPKQAFTPIKTSGLLKFTDRDAITAAINEVRSNPSTNWALIGYVSGTKDTLELRGSGTGGADELSSQFVAAEVMYAIVKVSDQIDSDLGSHSSVTTKYVVVHLLGPQTPIMHKAKIGTVKGEVDSLIGARQISIDCSDASEVSHQRLSDLVGKTSGSKSNEVQK